MESSVGAFEAKTHLARLLDRVEEGESVTITRNGKPVARLVPAHDPRTAQGAVDRILAFREELRAKGVRVTQAEIKAWIAEVGADGMPPVVLDSSLTMAGLLPDEATDVVAEVFSAAVAAGIVVPSIWCAEVGNAALVAERKGRITVEGRREGLARLARLPVEIEAVDRSLAWGQVLELAQRHRLTAYDASYLELAVRRRARLATFDNALRDAAAAEGVRLLPA